MGDEMTTWLEGIKLEQAERAIDEQLADCYADLWCLNHDAKAIKDKGSPAAADVHARINATLAAMGL